MISSPYETITLAAGKFVVRFLESVVTGGPFRRYISNSSAQNKTIQRKSDTVKGKDYVKHRWNELDVYKALRSGRKQKNGRLCCS